MFSLAAILVLFHVVDHGVPHFDAGGDRVLDRGCSSLCMCLRGGLHNQIFLESFDLVDLSVNQVDSCLSYVCGPST